MPVYKDKKTGKWYCKFYYKDWVGKQRQKWKRGFPTKREAKEYERNFLQQQAASIGVSQIYKLLAFEEKNLH